MKYGDNSLTELKGPDRVRKRPAVIFGSDGIEGCRHSVFEILSNSIDEAREGYGNEVVVRVFADRSIEISDKGRGIPIDFNSREEKYNWELAFCTLYAGGKYDNNSGDNYSFALGLNGLGLCATQFSAEYMEVVSDNGKYSYQLRFEKGHNTTGNQKGFIRTKTSGQTGTTIKWRPDLDVFTDINITPDYFDDILRRQAVVNDGLRFVLMSENGAGGDWTEEIYCYENGITDYLKEAAGDTLFTLPQLWEAERRGRDREDKDDYRVKLKVALAFSNTTRLIEHYHNSSWLEYGGSPDKAMRAALVSQIDGFIKQNGKYNKGESKITFTDVEDCLIFISNNFSTQTSYENQTKKSVTNRFIAEAMTDWLRHQIEVYFLENKDDAARICSQVLVNKRSRENAESARLNLKKKLSGTIDMTNRVGKFVDCRSKDLSRRELYIVEGDSALGAVKTARDADFQAVIPIRGKILNCLKSGYDKIFKNDIITDLIKVMGCGIEVQKHTKDLSAFNIDNFRWNKIVICTDADVDGFQIRTLVLTMLYRLTPTLINEGFVYIAESPLYEINQGDNAYFAYDEGEKTKIIQMLEKKSGNGKYKLQRSKGLGENEPEMMSLTTMNPNTRRLIKVSPSDVTATRNMFDLLLGDNLQGRKDYIAQFGRDYLDDADLM